MRFIYVFRFTTKYVSPGLQQTELEAVGKTTTTHGNMEVWKTRQCTIRSCFEKWSTDAAVANLLHSVAE